MALKDDRYTYRVTGQKTTRSTWGSAPNSQSKLAGFYPRSSLKGHTEGGGRCSR